jgi:tellurite resistance protein TerC
MTALWATFLAFVGLLLSLELFVFNRRPRATTPNAAVAWTAFYVLLAALLNVGIYLVYEHHWLGAAGGSAHPERHEKASIQFLSCYLLEAALSLDSVFAISAIFTHFKVPEQYRRRVLMAGLLPSIIVRGGLILGGAALVTRFHWFVFVLSALLVLAALRMLVVRRENMDPDRNWIYKLLRRFFPTEAGEAGGNLFAVNNGRPALTPLLTVLVLVETADGLYAFDSLPGVFAYSRDPFIIFAAHTMALFTCRAMYFALEPHLGWLRYVKIGLACLLAYTAIAVSIPTDIAPKPEVSLAVLTGMVLVGLLAAALFGHSGPAPETSPLGEDAERLARLTLRQSRRVIALLVGSAVVLVGLIMVPGPGPGLLVVPIGLAILGAEFLWARRLLDKYKTYALKAGMQANERLTRTPRPWLIPIVYGATIAGMVLLVRYTRLSPAAVIAGTVPLLIGESVWAVVTVRRYRAQKRGDGPAVGNGNDGGESNT